MNGTRKSAKDRESQGIRVGVSGLLFAGFGAYVQAPRLIGLALVVAVIGLLIWLAAMARRD